MHTLLVCIMQGCCPISFQPAAVRRAAVNDSPSLSPCMWSIELEILFHENSSRASASELTETAWIKA